MRYWGANNVFLDPSSPVTYNSISNNGQELVSAETGSLSLTSALSPRWISHLRAQFSRDRQQSYSNTSDVLVKIPKIIDGMGRSNLLPRQTLEHRLHLAETVSLEGSRNTWKFGGDGLFTWIYDFFPNQQSDEYLFYPIKVNPFTFEPMQSGLPLSPLRAYAHEVPHYYLQNFGSATSHPNSNDYAAFAQDTIRVTNHLAVNLGVRWDLQTFTTAGLLSNPLFPPSGKVPFQPYNFAPRAGLAYSFGNTRPLVVRAGYGIFFVRIPQIYNSVIETENGITDASLFLNNSNYYDHQVFPGYPNALVSCPLDAATCALPAGLTQGVTKRVAAFAPNFVTPRVQQASLTLEKEVVSRTTVALTLLNVRGEHLIRALDVNLAQPTAAHVSHIRFHRLCFYRRLLHCRFLRHLAIYPLANLPLATLHQSARPAHRATRRHQRIPECRFQRLQGSVGLHHTPRRPRILSALLLYLRSGHRRRPGRPRSRSTCHRTKFVRAQRRARTQRHRPAPAPRRSLLRRHPPVSSRPGISRPHL
jgi:hypothetical protein